MAAESRRKRPGAGAGRVLRRREARRGRSRERAGSSSPFPASPGRFCWPSPGETPGRVPAKCCDPLGMLDQLGDSPRAAVHPPIAGATASQRCSPGCPHPGTNHPVSPGTHTRAGREDCGPRNSNWEGREPGKIVVWVLKPSLGRPCSTCRKWGKFKV